MRKCGSCGERLEPSSGPGRPAEYCSVRCRDLARRHRDRQLIRIGREVKSLVKSLVTKEADHG